MPENAVKIKFKGHYSECNNRLYPNQDYLSEEYTLSDLTADTNCFYGAPPDEQMNRNTANPGRGENAGWLGGSWGKLNEVNKTGDNSRMIPEDTPDVTVTDGSIYYAPSTLYDYYSDYELWGRALSSSEETKENGFKSQPLFSWNRGISNYYRTENNNAIYPLYFGGSRMLTTNSLTAGILTGSLLNHNINISGGNGYSGAKNKNIMQSASSYAYFPNKGLLNATSPIDSNENLYLQNSNKAVPYFNKEFLEGNNEEKVAYGAVYENLEFPFKLKDNGYYQYDSARDNALRVIKDRNGKYYLKEQDGKVYYQETNGGNFFFPFNEAGTYTSESKLDHMFGAKIEVPFSLNTERQITVEKEDGSLEKKDCVFTFSGDDDVWIFIEDEEGNTQKLALDIGGSHGAVAGAIDFRTGIVATSGKWGWNTDASAGLGYDSQNAYAMSKDTFLEFMESQDNSDQSEITDKAAAQKYINEEYKKYKSTTDEFSKYCDVTTLDALGIKLASYHNYKIKVFYMERGLDQSNLRITFAFTSTKYVQIEKEWADGTAKDDHSDAEFSLYQTTATPDADGNVTVKKAEVLNIGGDSSGGRLPDAVLKKDNGWKYTWKNLAATAASSGNGSEYHYYIAETSQLSGYKVEYYDEKGNELPEVTMTVENEDGTTKKVKGVLADESTKVIVRNTRYGDLEISKKLDLDDATGFDLNDQEFGFVLTSDDEKIEGNSYKADLVTIDEAGNSSSEETTITIGQTFGLKNNQTVKVKNLPISWQDDPEEKVTYTVKESEYSGTVDSNGKDTGFKTEFNPRVTVTAGADISIGSDTGTSTFPDTEPDIESGIKMEFVNTLEGSITIIKDDEKGNKLQGVGFTIKYYDTTDQKYKPLDESVCSDNDLIVAGGTVRTDADGKARFANLKLGHTYQITETEPLPGTNGLKTPISDIELPKLLTEKSGDSVSPITKTTDGKYVYADLVYTVTNNSFSMPVTGGNGFFWPGLLGLGLAACGYMVWLNAERKKHRNRKGETTR